MPATTTLVFALNDINSPPGGASATSIWDVQSGRTFECWVKEFSSGTVTGFKFFKTTCALYTPGNSLAGVQINTPTLHQFIDGLRYEVVVTADQAETATANNYGIGFRDQQTVNDASLLIKDGATLFHYQIMRHQKYDRQRVIPVKFYITQLIHAQPTELFLQF